jgi:hypothetical protein
MGKLEHSTPAMAIRYQPIAQDRDAEIARRLSAMVEPRLTPIPTVCLSGGGQAA